MATGDEHRQSIEFSFGGPVRRMLRLGRGRLPACVLDPICCRRLADAVKEAFGCSGLIQVALDRGAVSECFDLSGGGSG
jgi:hypothetical protein